MKRKDVFRRLLCCLLSAVLCAALTGCGGASGASGDVEKKAADGRDIPADEAADETRPTLPTDVENNGGDYVRVDRKVYFRCYGPDALDQTAVFGTFTDPAYYTGGETRILSRDLDSGEVREVLKDAGYGPLYYGDGGFYLQERTGERDQVVWYSLDGTQREPLCNGTVLGITPGGLLAVRWDSDLDGEGGEQEQFRLYRNTSLTASMDVAGNETFIGLTEDGLFYMQEISVETTAEAETEAAEVETEAAEVRSVFNIWQLDTDGTQIQLGTLPEREDEENPYGVLTRVDGFAPARNQVGICVGTYSGTGIFLQEDLYAAVTPGQADSLVPLEVPEAYRDEETEDGDRVPYCLAVDPEGELVIVQHLLNEIQTDWETGDLQRFDGQSWQTLLPGLSAVPENGTGFQMIVQSAQWVDGAAYVTLACSHAAPAENVGWRDAYALLHMLYLRVTEDGQAEELAGVDHEAVLCGMAWFVKGEDALLWQERGDGWSEVNGVYRIPIAPDAVWDGGKDAILSHAAWASLTELDEASYYGYPIPETGTEELLYLRLDREGRAVYLTETAPNALLSIQMGMPESELDGAAEVVSIPRRPSDEDTPWYWAKLTALQDGVDLRLERTPDDDGTGMEQYAIMEGVFVPGYTIAHRVLNKGEYVAVRASLPWYPETRVSVGKDGTWGAYVFGEDNSLHLENEDGSIPEKIVAGYALPDLSSYGGIPNTLLHGGKWFYYEEGDRQTALAEMTFGLEGAEERDPYQEYSGYGDLDVTVASSDEDVHRFRAMWDSLYPAPYGMPDVLRFYALDAPMDSEGEPKFTGDYRVDIYRTDGLELLRLTQMNNGDGILSNLIPGAGDRAAFTFVRWRGIGEPGAKLWNTVCPAVVVRDVPDGIGIWMQEAEQVDVREDGSPLYMPIFGAPCLPYAYSVEAAVPEGDWPVQVCVVSVDRDGVVQEIEKAA